MDNQKPTAPQEEIDLNAILTKIGNSIGSVWTGFLRLLAILRRVPLENKLSFSLIIVASIIFGVVFKTYLRESYYESTMILSSDYINKRLAENTIDKLTLLASEKNKKGLARELNLPDTLADNIVEFAVKPFVSEGELVELEVLKEQLRNAQTNANNQAVINQVIRRIEIENRHAFEITVRTLNPTVIPNLQSAIVHYFSNNPYVRKRVEVNKANLQQRRTKLIADLRKLDSLKQMIYENYRAMASRRDGSNNVILSDKPVTSPLEVYDQGLTLYNQLQEVERQLYLQPDFEIIEGFTEFSEPASPSLLRILLYSFGIGVVIAYLDIGLRRLNSYLSTIN